MAVPSPRPKSVSPERFRALREKVLVWTQRDVADALGVTNVQVSRWERGEQKIKPIYWATLCTKAGVPEDWQPPAPSTSDPAEPPKEPEG